MSDNTTTTTGLMQAFDFEENAVRVHLVNEAPWFVAADVCKVLELLNPRQAITGLDEDEKMTVQNVDGHSGQRGGAQFFNLISESGLYALIFKSRKPEAKKFRRWVTGDVLPAIRKEGAYSLAKKAAQEKCAARFARLRRELASRVRRIIDRVDHVSDSVLSNGLPMGRVRACHQLGRLQLDAIGKLMDLEAMGTPARLSHDGTRVIVEQPDEADDD